MHIKRLLVATDFSDSSEAALDFASSLAAESGAKLYIAHVDELANISGPAIPPSEGGSLFQAPWGTGRREVRDRLAQIAPTVADVTFERCYLTGPTVEQIVQCAGEHQVDVIVIGSHGRTGILRVLLGSVAEGVMRTAECPVLIVKSHTANTPLDGTRSS
jgi:nucleotide-binding universal stress UspA family protein